MLDIDKIYHNLTGVDIEEQRKLWDERGKGYYGEYLVFEKLYRNIPGNCKILMNLHLPTSKGKTTEIDLLLIHETGIYVFEIKHYKGTIYGKEEDKTWIQYFRTAPNAVFQNPLRQNQYHIDALRNLLPDISTKSVIVFTSQECDLRVGCSDSESIVCQLSELSHAMFVTTTTKTPSLTPERIDDIFNQLLPYSPIAEKTVQVEGEEKPFYQYINAIMQTYHKDKKAAEDSYRIKSQTLEQDYTTKQQHLKQDYETKLRNLDQNYRINQLHLEQNYLVKEKHLQRKKNVSVFLSVLCIIVSIVLIVGIALYANWHINLIRDNAEHQIEDIRNDAENEIAKAQEQLQTFAQKFEHVDPYNNGDITLEDGFITVSDISLTDSIDVKNAVNFSFTLNWSGEYYGAHINQESKMVVILKDGSVKEYDILESAFPYSTTALRIGKRNIWVTAYLSYEFPTHGLHGIHANDISYIKLTNIDVWTMEADNSKPVTVTTGYEIELYNADT